MSFDLSLSSIRQLRGVRRFVDRPLLDERLTVRIRECAIASDERLILILASRSPSLSTRQLAGEVEGVFTTDTTTRTSMMINNLPAVRLACPVAVFIDVFTCRTFLLSGLVAPFDSLEQC